MGEKQAECLLVDTPAKATVRMSRGCEMLEVRLGFKFCEHFLPRRDSSLDTVTDSCRRAQETRKALRPEDLLDRGGEV